MSLPIVPSARFDSRVAESRSPVDCSSGGERSNGLFASAVTTLQINLGLRCNLACKHCHVESSPGRSSQDENMQPATARRIIDWLKRSPQVKCVDLTGGSPEMNASFQFLVTACRELGCHVIDRCNPTILVHRDKPPLNPGGHFGDYVDYGWAPRFLAEHRVEVFASLPCYLEDNVRAQRGRHAYADSIDGLKLLNEVGYGTNDELPLNLVFNPVGPSLPPPAENLEVDYRNYLRETFGLEFTRLVTITNMPIARWRQFLKRTGDLDGYVDKLEANFNSQNVDGLMCRHQIHIDHTGRIHDCDFNYAAGMPAATNNGTRAPLLWDTTVEELSGRRIETDEHCFGCTAGHGSSCGGSLS
ncbi:MAG: arsenosugar biosynthesis radical SAM (seleno)protein ArsS [Planctomycetota bacterium]